MVRRLPPLLALLIVPAIGGCGMRHLARTVGEGQGEIRAAVGGPFLGNLGAPAEPM